MDTKLQIRLDSELKDQVIEMAESQGHVLSQVIRDLLMGYVLSGGQTSVAYVSTANLAELSSQVSALDHDLKQLFSVLLEALEPVGTIAKYSWKGGENSG